jgi:hypothetical protein
MQNSKFWNPEKNYFALLLPLKAHNSNEGIMGNISEENISEMQTRYKIVAGSVCGFPKFVTSGSGLGSGQR